MEEWHISATLLMLNTLVVLEGKNKGMKKIFYFVLLASLFCSCEQIKKTITPCVVTFNEENLIDGSPDPTERQNAVNIFMAKYADFYPEEKLSFIREKLLVMDKHRFTFIFEVLDPDKMFLYSIFGGILGIDRFILGENFWGAVKFLTGGGFGILWIYDVFTIKSRTRENNFKRLEYYINSSSEDSRLKESTPLSFSSIKKITFDSFSKNDLCLYENDWFKLYYPNYCLIDSTHDGNKDPLFQEVQLFSNYDVHTGDTDMFIRFWEDALPYPENPQNLKEYADVSMKLRASMAQNDHTKEFMGCVVAEDSLKIDSYPASLRVYKYQKDDSFRFTYAFYVYIPQSNKYFNLYADIKEEFTNIACRIINSLKFKDTVRDKGTLSMDEKQKRWEKFTQSLK